MKRREFLITTAAGAVASSLGRFTSLAQAADVTAEVALVRTRNRAEGIASAMKLISFPSPMGRKVLLKPNFNTADPFPGSTHNDTLRHLVLEMKSRGAAGVTVGESCGPGKTKDVMENLGIPALSQELGFDVIDFDELPESDWVHCDPPGSHWKNGFGVARPIIEADYLLWTPCLKTHQFGGVHTMAIKLAVGVIHRNVRMPMHADAVNMRRMIAEIHHRFKPQLIVMDGLDIFVDGGPMTGKLAQADVMVAGTDLIAVEAVGLAVLKHHGSNDAIMSRKIFEQEQVARAVEMGLGVKSPGQIKIVTGDSDSAAYATKLTEILAQG
jgi:uncharacterized protein (DUF362 family)